MLALLRVLAVATVAALPLAQLGDAVPAILRALELPAVASDARQAGVADGLVRDVLDGLRRRGLPADEAALVVRGEVDAVKAGAPADTFGAFVQHQLDQGLRGRALAEAIRAEHQARGIGRPAHRGPPERDTPRPKGRNP